ncbi:protein FAM228B isoform X3 [Seriola lalandi dorsalis]|uniref:protein FAM228B isoform X3 n=1 Tax=Seriola lalandi dorsalis TaxID=1841481 RepID=UPI000C6FB6DA|nr:protein FAM228B isoform X3 [Seriola lalandi dorsalis]
MSPIKKKDTASGLITFHTPFPVSLLKPEECTAGVKDATGARKWPSQPSVMPRSSSGRVRAGERDEASPSGSQPGAKQDWPSHTSLRQLQLERFLSQRDVTQLRRRELLHKRWTERVWFPLQRRVEEHVSSCSTLEVKRRQSLYSRYLQHCNTKGFVFLETYDLKEYNPFLLNIKKPQYFKLNTADLKDSLHLQLHQRLEEKRTARSCEAGCKYTGRQAKKLPHSDRPLSESVTPQASTPQQASSSSRKTPVVDEAERRKFSRYVYTALRELVLFINHIFYNTKICNDTTTSAKNHSNKLCVRSNVSVSSRLDSIPYHINATATPDGRCHQTSCCFSTSGSLQQLQSFPTFK